MLLCGLEYNEPMENIRKLNSRFVCSNNFFQGASIFRTLKYVAPLLSYQQASVPQL